MARAANAYIDATRPFTLAKDPAKSAELDKVLHLCVHAVHAALVGLLPVMPEKATIGLQQLGVTLEGRTIADLLSQGLPAVLTSNPGLSSGYLMEQITAASLVAESRSIAMPASIGSLPTDANQEDFVPMGMAAADKASRILRNAAVVIAAELLCGAQGLEFLKPLRPGRGVSELYARIRSPEGGIPPLGPDRPPAPDLECLAARVLAGELAPSYLP